MSTVSVEHNIFHTNSKLVNTTNDFLTVETDPALIDIDGCMTCGYDYSTSHNWTIVQPTRNCHIQYVTYYNEL